MDVSEKQVGQSIENADDVHLKRCRRVTIDDCDQVLVAHSDRITVIGCIGKSDSTVWKEFTGNHVDGDMIGNVMPKFGKVVFDTGPPVPKWPWRKTLGFFLLGFVIGTVVHVAAANAATVHADATRTSETTLSVRLDVTVKHATTLYLEGCADIDGGIACGGGTAKKVKVRTGHSQQTVRVSNMAQHYTPPPLGTVEAWDAWRYAPTKTDMAFAWFKGKTALTEITPTATAVDTLTQEAR